MECNDSINWNLAGYPRRQCRTWAGGNRYPNTRPVSFLRWKSDFDGSMIAWSPVGEAISLPPDTTLRNGKCSGEFVQISNILPFNQPLENQKVAGGW